MSKLNPNALKWVEALESGEYEQGKEALCFKNRHCCLGVAFEVAIKNGVAIERKIKGNFVYFNNQIGCLDISITEWLGLTSQTGTYSIKGQKSALTIDNDLRKLNFKQIAAIIRSKPTGFFREGK